MLNNNFIQRVLISVTVAGTLSSTVAVELKILKGNLGFTPRIIQTSTASNIKLTKVKVNRDENFTLQQIDGW